MKQTKNTTFLPATVNWDGPLEGVGSGSLVSMLRTQLVDLVLTQTAFLAGLHLPS